MDLALKSRSPSDKHKFYLQSSMIGITRVICGFPFEHPIDAIKVQWQSQPQFKNEYQIISHIY
jgi:hypothetical protein